MNRWFVLYPVFLIQCYAFAQTPVADFTANVNTGCAPLLVNFTDLSTGSPTSWFWDFGNGNTSTLQNPNVIFLNPAAYSITLTVSNGSGSDTLIKTAYATVYNDPVVDFTVDTAIGCVPLTVNFTDASAPGSGSIGTWFWDFGDGNTSILPNPQHTYTIPGSYTVFLFVENTNGCQAQLFKSNYIAAYKPIAGFDILSTICHPPFAVDFNNSSLGSGLTYLWEFGDGDTSTLVNPTHTYTAAGSFVVKLLITNTIGCVDSAVLSMDIADLTADFDYTVLCTDSDFTITFADMSAPAPIQWRWNFGDGDTSGLQNPSHTYDTVGTYAITLVATLDSGCTDTVTRIYASPNALFSMDTNYSCESPFQITFTNLSTGTDSLFFQWDLGDGTTSSDTNVIHTYTVPQGIYIDSFFVSLVVTNRFGCTDTVRDTIIVNKPEAFFTALPPEGCIPLTVQFGDSSISDTTITAWYWDFGNGDTSTLQNPANIYVDTGHYTITLIITNALGCQDSLTKVDFIQSGIPPDFLDFTFLPDDAVPPADTMCFHNMYCFYDLSGFNDTTIKVNNWFWGFFESLLDGYGESHNSELQNPCEDSGHWPLFLNTTTDFMFVAGYNGCNDTLYKPLATVFPKSLIRYYNPDSSSAVLAACSPPITRAFYNGSVGYDSVLLFTMTDLQTGQVTNLDPNDTTAITFTSAGQYQFHIITKNDTSKAGGCVDGNSNWLLTIDSVHRGFTVTPDACLEGNAYTFTDTSISFYGEITEWYWDFGDGDTLRGSRTDTIFPGDNNNGRTSGSYKNPTHVYLDTGTYVVTLDIIVDVPYRCCGSGKYSYFTCFYFDSIGTILNVHEVYADFNSNITTGCPVLTINFLDSSYSTTSIFSWNWSFGDGDTSGLQNPVHAYTDTGIYTVVLIVEDSTGCIDTLIMVDYIGITSPVADFTASPLEVCIGDSFFFAPDTVYFSNLSVGDSLSFLWDFGDGSSLDTAQNPMHAYIVAGTYTVSLYITDKNSCTDTLIRNDYITVFNSPIVGFISDILVEDCTPIIVSLSDTSSSNIISWFWTFGDGQNSDEQNPTHIYTDTGVYQVSLYVIDSNGCKNLVIKAGLINAEAPTGSFIFSPDSGCIPLDVTFFANAQNTDFYFWDFGDGSPFGLMDSLVHTYNQTGSFTPNLVLADSNGCSFIALPNGLVYIEDLIPGFTVSDSVLCAIDSLYFTDTTFFVSPISWFWEFGDGDTSTVQHPTHLYDSTGLYDVTLTVISSECTLAVVKPNYISINERPEVSFTVSDTVECIPFTAQFSASITSNTSAINSLEWDFGDGSPVDTVQNPAHSYTASGSYYVTLTVTYGPGNCELPDTVSYIEVYDPPVAAFEASTTDPTCFSNSTFLFDNNSTSSDTYSWNFGDGNTSSEQNPAHTFVDTGYYIVQLITSNQINCADTVVITLHAFDYRDMILVPNVFSPNDDGINDVFYIGGSDLLQVEGMIFNRWGQKIYSWNDQEEFWDGRGHNGLPATEGVYYYILTICNEEEIAGFVHILR